MRGKIRQVLTFFQNHFSTLCQIAAAVSSVALLFFGETLFALSSLSILGVGILDRNGWLPFTCRQFLHRYSQPALIITGLAAGGVIDRAFSLLNVLSWCANTHLSSPENEGQDFVFQERLTPQKAADLLQGRLDLEINPRFIHYNPVPPIPYIDIQCFVEKFDQINWRRHLSALRQKLRDDPRFLERHQTPELKTDQEIVQIARHSLETFIRSVKERRVLEGEPADYEKLHNYLKLIAKHMEGLNDETTWSDILFRLAVEGGEYCGPGKFEVAESLYAQTIGDNPDIPFRDKIIYCLQDERNLWMQKFYSGPFMDHSMVSRFGRMIDWQDVHNYNLFLNLYGDEFGLRKAGAENDDTAIIEPLFKWIISYCLKEKIQKFFWNDHSLAQHIRILIGSIGTPKLPKPEVYAFWQNWIDRQELEESNREALKEELANGRLFNRPLEMEGQFNPEFVALMLSDMGIAKIESKALPLPSPLSSLQPATV